MHEMGRNFSGIHVVKFLYEISILFTCKASVSLPPYQVTDISLS